MSAQALGHQEVPRVVSGSRCGCLRCQNKGVCYAEMYGASVLGAHSGVAGPRGGACSLVDAPTWVRRTFRHCIVAACRAPFFGSRRAYHRDRPAQVVRALLHQRSLCRCGFFDCSGIKQVLHVGAGLLLGAGTGQRIRLLPWVWDRFAFPEVENIQGGTGPCELSAALDKLSTSLIGFRKACAAHLQQKSESLWSAAETVFWEIIAVLNRSLTFEGFSKQELLAVQSLVDRTQAAQTRAVQVAEVAHSKASQCAADLVGRAMGIFVLGASVHRNIFAGECPVSDVVQLSKEPRSDACVRLFAGRSNLSPVTSGRGGRA